MAVLASPAEASSALEILALLSRVYNRKAGHRSGERVRYRGLLGEVPRRLVCVGLLVRLLVVRVGSRELLVRLMMVRMRSGKLLMRLVAV